MIGEARQQPERIGGFSRRNGVLGVLRETLVDTAALSDADLARLRTTPGGAFGSCRFDLDPVDANPAQYDRLLFAVLAAHGVRYFLQRRQRFDGNLPPDPDRRRCPRLSADGRRCAQNGR